MSGAEMMNRQLTDTVNIGGTEHVLKACSTHSIRRLVYVSSYNVVYNGTPIVAGTEALPYPPLDSHTDRYSQTKTIAEQRVRQASGQDGLRVCIIRPAAIYGDGEQRHLPRILRTVRAGLAVFAIGSPDVLCDWVYVDHLVHALILAAAKLARDETSHSAVSSPAPLYFVSDDQPTNNFTFLSRLIRPLHNQHVFLFYVPTALLLRLAHAIELTHGLLCGVWPFEPFLTRAEVLKVGRTHWMSVQRAKDELGWTAVVGVDEAMRRCVEWYLADGWASEAQSKTGAAGGRARMQWVAATVSCVLLLWMVGTDILIDRSTCTEASSAFLRAVDIHIGCLVAQNDIGRGGQTSCCGA